MSFTPNYNLETPFRGEYSGTWDLPINSNFDKLDAILLDITNSHKSYSMPTGFATGSLWYDLNWNILKFKKRNIGNSSDYVTLIDEENMASLVTGFVRSEDGITPPVPTNLSLSANTQQYNGQINLYSFTATWDGISGSFPAFDRFIVQIASTSGPAITQQYSTALPSYTFSNLLPNTTWNIKVMSVSKQGNASAWCTAMPRSINNDTTAPGIPQNVTQSAGLSDALINWDDVNASDLAGYEVYAKTDIGPPINTTTRVAIVIKNSALIRLMPKTSYYIYVRSFDRTGNYSAYSAPIICTTSSTLSSIGGNAGEIETGPLTILGNNSYLRSGQSAFNVGQGFWLGMISGVPRFSIGDSAGNRFTWDGSSINLVGNLSLASGNSIMSGQTAFNTGKGFFLGKDINGLNSFSLGDPAGNSITYRESTGSLDIKGQLTIAGGIGYNTLSDIPSSTIQRIAIKKNYINYTTPQLGQAYIHGFDSAGAPADVSGKILYGSNNGQDLNVEYNIPKAPVFTSKQNVTGYILIDLSFANRFVVSGSPVNMVFVQKVSGMSWQYDNNSNQWIQFQMDANCAVIGKITTSPIVGHNISTCEVWQYGLLPDTTSSTNSILGNSFGSGITPPSILASPSYLGSGLFANNRMIGFIENGVWKNYLDNTGKFYFSGTDLNNRIDWGVTTANTLTIRGKLDASDLKTGVISADRISANSITGDKLTVDSITAREIAAGSISSTELAAGSVTAGKIGVGAITANEIAANSITAANIKAGELVVGDKVTMGANAVISWSNLTTETQNALSSGARQQIVMTGYSFLRYPSTPSTPTGGSFSNPVATGWTNGIPSGTNPIYVTSRKFTSDGLAPQEAVWSTPTLFVSNGINGTNGTPGSNGLSISWRGELAAPPISPSINWVYKNTVNGWVYIYNGTTWDVMVVDGNDGIDGTNGLPGSNGLSVFITYHDNAITAPPALPTASGTTGGWHTSSTTSVNWMSQKVALDSSSGTWGTPFVIKGASGTNGTNGVNGAVGVNGTSIEFKGSFSIAPASPSNGWAYYNTTDKKSYVYQSGAWYQMTVDGIAGANGTNGTNGLSIVWKGESANPPANPVLNWVYRDTDNGLVYIWNGTAWALMVLDGNDGIDGTNGTDGLSVFITYNDSPLNAYPATPTGDGTWAGWHTNPTTAVNWMSQKVSSSATTGTWSVPFAIRGVDGVNGTNGTNGVNGTRTAILELYKWSATTPTTFPTGTSRYTWSTGQFTSPATLNGWSAIPLPPVAGQTLWVCYTVYADTLTTAFTDILWNTTTAFVSGAAGANGSNGANGQRVGVLEIYKWAPSAPTTYPAGTSQYTWATGAFTAPTTPNGWALVPGAATPGWTLYGISVSVSDLLTTATSVATWNSTTAYPIGYAGTDGTDGINGAAGVNGTSIEFRGSFATAPTLPSNGWAYYNTTTKKSYVYQSGTWYQMTVDGVNGANGTNGTNGLSIVWKGESANPPANPAVNWVYKDTDNGLVYLWDGVSWVLMVADGNDGTNGTNGIDGLNVYITYNDNALLSPPSIPTGDGTTGGWHTAPTAAVIWMSQKVAANATSGIWGAPFAIKGSTGATGASAVTGFLTNESVVVAAMMDGTVPSLAGTGGTFSVFEGVVDKTGVAGPTTYSIVGTPTISANINATTGVYNITLVPTDTGYVTFRANYKGTNIDKIYSISKSRTGLTGNTGAPGKTVGLSTTSQVFSYLADTGLTPLPSTATVTATAYNTSGTVYYRFLVNGVEKQHTTSNTYVYTPQVNYISMPQQLVLEIREGSVGAVVIATDIMSMIGLKPGKDGTNGLTGATVFLHVRYSANADGTGMTTTPQADSIYLGSYSSTEAEGTGNTNNKAYYNWVKVQGPALVDGVTTSSLVSFLGTRGLSTTIGSNFIFTGTVGANAVISAKVNADLIESGTLNATLINAGTIQSVDFVSGGGGKGFRISPDGSVEFNNATVRGNVEATTLNGYNIATLMELITKNKQPVGRPVNQFYVEWSQGAPAPTITVNGSAIVISSLPYSSGAFWRRFNVTSGQVVRITPGVTIKSLYHYGTASDNLITTLYPGGPSVSTGDLDGDGLITGLETNLTLTTAASSGSGDFTVALNPTWAKMDVAPIVSGIPAPSGIIDIGDVIVLLSAANAGKVQDTLVQGTITFTSDGAYHAIGYTV
jgi:hypothetical protein